MRKHCSIGIGASPCANEKWEFFLTLDGQPVLDGNVGIFRSIRGPLPNKTEMREALGQLLRREVSRDDPAGA